jgi:hypothetical protein
MNESSSPENTKANDEQVGGDHYKHPGEEEHWDRAWRLDYDCFQYIITKWVERWKFKDGLKDLRKAQHAIAKYIEVVEGESALTPAGEAATLDDVMYRERPSRFKDPKEWTEEERAEVAGHIEQTNPLLNQFQTMDIFTRLDDLENAIGDLRDHWRGANIPTPADLLTTMPSSSFTYEGGTATGDVWTCKACGTEIRASRDTVPGRLHDCRKEVDASEPGPGYVNQG